MSVIALPKATTRILTELTGEHRLDLAILLTLRDSVEHRLENIEAEISQYEKKYGMSFEEFERKGKSGELPDVFSYKVERDYMRWEGLLSRRKKIKELKDWLM